MMRWKLLALLCICMCAAGGCASIVLNSQKVKPEQCETIGTGLHYFLPKGFIKLRLTQEKGVLSLEYVETVYKPDYENFFVLRYEPVGTAEDDVKIDISNEGLLDKITVTSKEKSGEIVIKIMELAKQAAKAAASLPVGKAAVPKEAKIVKEFVLDLTDQKVIDKIVDEYLEGTFTVALERSFNISSPIAQKTINEFCNTRRSVYYRPLLPYTLKIMTPDKRVVLAEHIVLLPNEAPVLGVDVTRAAFVENFTELDFTNGTLQSIHIKKPSEALAFMEIPLNIVKGIASIPAEIIQIKIDYSSKNKQLLDAYKAELKAREELEKLRQQLEALAQ